MENQIVIFHVEKFEDGSLFIGNSELVDPAVAVELIEKGLAKADGHALGVVPSGLVVGKKKRGAEVTDHGGDSK